MVVVARRAEHPAAGGGWAFAPTAKRVRARRAGRTVADSRAALLVWEPGVPYPWYAFPREDVSVDAQELEDEELRGHVLLRFADADEWLEEDEPVIGHPRDPFHRIDARRSSRHVRVELDGVVLADASRSVLVFETGLPVRTYFEPGDVRLDLLEPSSTRTTCAYKGHAVHFARPPRGDVAWCYEEVLDDSPPVAGLIAFYDERVDFIVDGERRPRPHTQWSG